MTPRVTAVTWLALLLLTATSFALSYVSLGGFGPYAALAIAAVKASLVALVFMELLTAPFTVRATLFVGALLVFVLVFFVTADVVTRAAPPLLVPPP